jgi:hypothetical protein
LARLLLGTVVAAFALWIIGLNWSSLRSGRSWIPLLGGLAAIAAMFILPFPHLRDYWWIPLLVDWGSAPGLLHALVVHSRRRGKP